MAIPAVAMKNVAEHFRANQNIREPGHVDYLVEKGYEALIEAELHHTQHTYLF